MAMENTGLCFMFHVDIGSCFYICVSRETLDGSRMGGETDIKNSIRICADKSIDL